MNTVASSNGAGRVLADGAARGFAAEMLLLPTGLVTAAVLGRVLGPVGYGEFALAVSIVGWVTATSISLLGRAAVKLVSEATDWRPIAAALLRTRLSIGGVCALLVMALSFPLSRWFHVPDLARLLPVFAIDVLVNNLSRAHRETLTGLGRYREVASLSSVRWLTRLVILVAMVLWQRSVMAAVVASVLISGVELLIASRMVHLPWRAAWHRATRVEQAATTRRLWVVAAPLLLFGIMFQLHARISLFAISVLQTNAETIGRETGWFGASQNLAVVSGLFTATIGPLLLSSLGRLQRDGQDTQAVELSRNVLRLTLAMMPGAAIVFACSSELIAQIFGTSFLGAAPLVGPLFLAGLALCLLTVEVSILTAANHARTVSGLGVVLLGSAALGNVILVPRLGAFGAAMATLGSAALSAVAGQVFLYRLWRVQGLSTIARGVAISAIVYGLGLTVITTTWWALGIKLILLSLAVLLGFFALGELSAEDRAHLRAMISQRIGTPASHAAS